MVIESWKLAEKDKIKKEKSDKQKKIEQKKLLENIKLKKKINEISKSDEALSQLKDLIDWKEELNLSDDDIVIIKNAIEWNKISDEDVENILDKIDDIEKTDWVDKYLPKEARITKEDYKKALVDDIFRVKIITKLDVALTILARHANPWTMTWVNLFSWYMAILDKKLVKIQESHIDIKESLETSTKEIENKWLWQQIKDFFYDLLKNN